MFFPPFPRYVLLALPPSAPPAVFRGVHWSAGDTCASQMRAVLAADVPMRVGETHRDVDDWDDLRALARALAADAGAGERLCPETWALMRACGATREREPAARRGFVLAAAGAVLALALAWGRVTARPAV